MFGSAEGQLQIDHPNSGSLGDTGAEPAFADLLKRPGREGDSQAVLLPHSRQKRLGSQTSGKRPTDLDQATGKSQRLVSKSLREGKKQT